MPSQRYHRDREGAFYGADGGLDSSLDVWRNEQHHHHRQNNVGYGYFAMRPEYAGRFSAANGGYRRYSDQVLPQHSYNIPQPPPHRSLPYYHGYPQQYHYPQQQMSVEQRRALLRKKHSSKAAKKRQRSSAQFYPGVVYPNSSQQYYSHYRNAFPSSPTSPTPNLNISSPNYLAYQQTVGIDDAVYHQDMPHFSYHVGGSSAPMWYKNETDLPNTFAGRFTRDNRPYYVSDEKSRGESRRYDEYGGRGFNTSIDEVEEEIERNVQDLSSDLENYKNEIILRPPGSRAGLAISRPISRIETANTRPTSRTEVGRQGARYNNVVQNCDISEHPVSSSWTSQLASILKSKQENNKPKPYNPKVSKTPAQQHQVIHKFLPTFGIHQQIVEQDDHMFNDFECNCNGCNDENGPLPEDNKSNLGHSYYNLLDDGNGHFEHDPNNNRIESDTNKKNIDKITKFDEKNVPKLRYIYVWQLKTFSNKLLVVVMCVEK